MHLEIVTGKGGTGKSALTAALALRRAQMGHRVLALATSDPRRLGAHLGRQSVSSEATEISDGLLLALIAPGPALQEYLRTNLNVPTPRMALATKGFDALATAAPGIKELVTVGKIISEAESGEWDSVFVDAPATGQIAACLNAPETVAGLVPSGRLREQADRMWARLADKATRLTIVTLAEELPITETREALVELAGTASTIQVVANRVLPELATSPHDVEHLGPSAHRDAAVLHTALTSSQRRWLAEMDVARELPYLFGVLTPAEVAARLSEELR
jgi:anion-transporting  ArsA/GET3 family ATPase